MGSGFGVWGSPLDPFCIRPASEPRGKPASEPKVGSASSWRDRPASMKVAAASLSLAAWKRPTGYDIRQVMEIFDRLLPRAQRARPELLR